MACYSVNQKRLCEVIHGKKYLGEKQKNKGTGQKHKGTENDPEMLDEEEENEEEEEEEETQRSRHPGQKEIKNR